MGKEVCGEDKWKDAGPVATVNKIKDILKNAGLETEYYTFDSDLGECCSSRVEIKGYTFVGTNGKGIGPEYCMASAYAELMERLQNRVHSSSSVWRPKDLQKLMNIFQAPIYEVRGEYQPELIKRLKKTIAENSPQNNPFFSSEEMVDMLLEEIAAVKSLKGFCMDSYYSVSDDEIINLPTDILLMFSMSNGMAAGNTLEEAIVQGMSEIFERYATLLFVRGKLIPPKIPHDYLMKFPDIANILDILEKNENYSVQVYDCSLGGKIPVVCGVVCNKKTQTYGIKFGSHPDMAIALERVFTEAMQGSNLGKFTRKNYPVFDLEEFRRENAFNLIKVGEGGYPASIFCKKSTFDFTPWPDLSGQTNLSLMRHMLDTAKEMGSNVYIRNCSFLGFPTIYIYAENLSEVMEKDILYLKEATLKRTSKALFNNISECSDDEIRKLSTLIKIKMHAVIEDSISSISDRTFVSKANVPANNGVFLLSLCEYRLGFLDEAIYYMRLFSKSYAATIYERSYSGCAVYYFEAKKNGFSEEENRTMLCRLCEENLAMKVCNDLEDPRLAIEKIYSFCKGHQCEDCDNKLCRYPDVAALSIKMAELEMKNPPDQNEVAKLFRE